MKQLKRREHDWGNVMAQIAPEGSVIGPPTRKPVMVRVCRKCGMRPNGEYLYGVGIFRMGDCPD